MGALRPQILHKSTHGCPQTPHLLRQHPWVPPNPLKKHPWVCSDPYLLRQHPWVPPDPISFKAAPMVAPKPLIRAPMGAPRPHIS